MLTKPLAILLPIFLPYVCVLAAPKKIQIAGLFDQDEAIQRMFKSSVKEVNKYRHRIEELSNVYLAPEMERIEEDTLEASSKVCELLDMGVAAIFGPQEKIIAEHVQSICDTVEVPHITVRQDFNQLPELRGLSLNLYPHVNSLSRVYEQLVTEYKWKSFAILYDNIDSLIRMRLLLKRWNVQGDSAIMFQLGEGPNYRKGMQEIKSSNIENIIIDCSIEILDEVLKQAQQVGLLSDKYKVIVTSLDLQTLDLEPYQYSGVNLTGVRLIDPKDSVVTEILERYKIEWGLDHASQLQVEPALMFDAVQLFARALKQLKDAMKVDVKKLPCDGTERWEHGLSLSNFMRSIETRGLTGLVKFDRDGFRTNIQLDIVHLAENGLKKIGEWNSTMGEKIDWISESGDQKSNGLAIQNRTLIVLIALTKPYAMRKESMITLSGNERYEGFCVDIIQEISQILHFNYTLQVEKSTGKLIKDTKKWTGMLGKIIADEADMAITDLTITSEREEYVDFTNPFLNLGISILYKKPSKEAPSLFSFLLPFSNEVWFYLIGAYVVVSLLLFINGRLCPAEWNNPYPCIEETETLQNQFSMKNSFWFAIGSIMQQGSEIAPIGISTRMIASCWWFFCLIMVSSYTANLAAFLTTDTIVQPFDNVEELAKKKNIKYGAKADGSTYKFFETSTHGTYQTMYEYMKAHKNDVVVADNDLGIKKAIWEDYAFLMESASLEYEVERNCEVHQVNGWLDEKGYGIALKKNSPFLHDMNTAVLQLLQSGAISDIKKKWWTQKRGGGKCTQNTGTSGAQALDLKNVGGMFVVLIIGTALSCVYTIIELLLAVAQTSKQENVSFKEELLNELKLIAKCSGTKSTRRKNGSSNKSDNGSTRECTPPYGFIPTVIRTSPADSK
ncbi:hypothetical protein PUN28_010224 [Cardiocondyla obscurior]|uniref:Uncharacterized protein n=2 Tax=Cardiocondyla obscurior TaxID=286306 RepID=A0AAW2FMP3_9HYME